MNASINVGISTVNKFFEYLHQTGTAIVPDNLVYVEERYKPRNILALHEINQLTKPLIKNTTLKARGPKPGKRQYHKGTGQCWAFIMAVA